MVVKEFGVLRGSRKWPYFAFRAILVVIPIEIGRALCVENPVFAWLRFARELLRWSSTHVRT